MMVLVTINQEFGGWRNLIYQYNLLNFKVKCNLFSLAYTKAYTNCFY